MMVTGTIILGLSVIGSMFTQLDLIVGEQGFN